MIRPEEWQRPQASHSVFGLAIIRFLASGMLKDGKREETTLEKEHEDC